MTADYRRLGADRKPFRVGVYCRKSNCGKRDTDPIHSSK